MKVRNEELGDPSSYPSHNTHIVRVNKQTEIGGSSSARTINEKCVTEFWL
jgi:hypothetical protein